MAHLDLWRKSSPLKPGYDNVSVIIESGETVTISQVQGVGWMYEAGCDRLYVEDEAEEYVRDVIIGERGQSSIVITLGELYSLTACR